MAAHYGRRLRKGAATTAVAAIAMAALTASQAPGFAGTTHSERDSASGTRPTPPSGTPIDGGSSYQRDLPPLVKPGRPDASKDLPGSGSDQGQGPLVVTGPAERGIPATVLAAYKKAEAALREQNPGCNLPWELLAAIGKVESGQARGGAVDAQGTTRTPILGPQLNGNGFANITDTDNGRYDGDTTHDRAVGPMQFIPSTWASWGRDGNGDGAKDPNNVYDAALAAGGYLCAGGRDLSVKAHLDRAILGYNHSQAYLNTVLSWFEFYRNGTHQVPDSTSVVPSGTGSADHSGKPKDTNGKNGKSKDKNKDKTPGKPKDDGKGKPTPKPNDPAPGQGGTDDGKPNPQEPPLPTPATVSDIAAVGGGELTSVAGQDFTAAPRVRAVNAQGKPVAGVKVRYEIQGETDSAFSGSQGAVRQATVLTDRDGIAEAPKLHAGQVTGEFTVRATVVDKDLDPADFTATVTAPPTPPADSLVRTDTTVLAATTAGSFTDRIHLKADYQGKAAAGVLVTATMVTTDLAGSRQNDKGPYFKDAHGKPVRVLSGLKTGADGALVLPQIFTDDQAGDFRLRLTTEDGAALVVTLHVTAATAG
ncbi:lytic transglycosylase domain-containing protein [Streptomyces palmae]|uniref:Lytic transglycosylase n=1 Tax=Streptomyces palmae TaxID=1701085 RepID=A0A4Z0H6Q6_9ACTN|nr:lytic murein transglycosylase [Streptomyces palmae]TGB08571.1 lytic transglycosylase [Streptomyces palmae]